MFADFIDSTYYIVQLKLFIGSLESERYDLLKQG